MGYNLLRSALQWGGVGGRVAGWLTVPQCIQHLYCVYCIWMELYLLRRLSHILRWERYILVQVTVKQYRSHVAFSYRVSHNIDSVLEL